MNADSKHNGDRIAPLNDYMDDFEAPSEGEILHYRAKLDRRGITIEEQCTECGEPTEIRVLPEDKDVPEPAKGTMCGDCAEEHLRSVELL